METPELRTLNEFKALCKRLLDNQMKLLQELGDAKDEIERLNDEFTKPKEQKND
jgi:hypothetical protein